MRYYYSYNSSKVGLLFLSMERIWSRSMVLVEDEVCEWERVVEQEGEEILEGELLQEAVNTLEAKVTETKVSTYAFIIQLTELS